MVDMAHVTGGCHYSYGCDNYASYCESCPGVNSVSAQKKIDKKIKSDMYYIKKYNISIVCPVNFALTQAIKSTKPFYSYHAIKHFVNTKVFCYKREVKSNNVNVVFIGAYNSNNSRKDFMCVESGLYILNKKLEGKGRKLVVLLPENQIHESINGLDNISIRTYSFATSDKELSKIYNMSDLFINTSIDDTGPTMIWEALSCGVPVVATKTGLTDELIQNNPEFGFAIDISDYNSLALRIYDVLFSDFRILPSKDISNKFNSIYNNVPYISEVLTSELEA